MANELNKKPCFSNTVQYCNNTVLQQIKSEEKDFDYQRKLESHSFRLAALQHFYHYYWLTNDGYGRGGEEVPNISSPPDDERATYNCIVEC